MPRLTERKNWPQYRRDGKLKPLSFSSSVGGPAERGLFGTLGVAGRDAIGTTQDTETVTGDTQTHLPGSYDDDEFSDSGDERTPLMSGAVLPEEPANTETESIVVPSKKDKHRRVTFDPPVADSLEESERVTYPDLREYALGQNSFSSTRHLSATRLEHVTGDLELVHRYEEEDGRMAEYLVLYHDLEDGTLGAHNTVAQVSSQDELIKSVCEHPKEWHTVINKYTDLQESGRVDLQNAENILERAQAANAAALKEKADAVNAKVETERRIRSQQSDWEAYRQQVEDKVTKSTKESEELKTTNEKARLAVRRLRTDRDGLRDALRESEEYVAALQ